LKLGEIQGIVINGEGYSIENIETIWFTQAPAIVRNIQIKALYQRDFKISDILVRAGFKISDKEQFDSELRVLLLKICHRLNL